MIHRKQSDPSKKIVQSSASVSQNKQQENLDKIIGNKLKAYQKMGEKPTTPAARAAKKRLALEIERLLKNDKIYIRTQYLVDSEATRASKLGMADLVKYSISNKGGMALQDEIRHDRIKRYTDYFNRKSELKEKHKAAIQELLIDVQQICQDNIDKNAMTQSTFDRIKLLDQRIAEVIKELNQTKNRDIVTDEMAEVLTRQRALHKQAIKQLADEMEQYIDWIDESHKSVANNPFDRSYMADKPANSHSIFNRISHYKKYLEGCKAIFHGQGGKSTADYMRMMEKMNELEKVGRARKKDIMAMEDDKSAYANYQYHKIVKAQKNLVQDASIMDAQQRQDEFELINHEIEQMEKMIIAERSRLIKKSSQHAKRANKIALRIDIMQDYVDQLKQNQGKVKKSIQQAEVNKVKQYNALTNALASRHEFKHTADGKYILFIPTDKELSSADGQYLQQELRKYENSYQQYKNSMTVEKNLPYQSETIEVMKDSVTVIDQRVEKNRGEQQPETEKLTVDEYLARREKLGKPVYLFPLASEQGLSTVLDLSDNMAKIYRIPGDYDPTNPEQINTAIENIAIQTEPALGIPTVLNTNANKSITDGGSANPTLIVPRTVTIDKKCGAQDFVELIREQAEDVENFKMDRERSNQQINQIVLQQLKLKKQWKDSNNSRLHMDDKIADWRVTPPLNTDRESTNWRVYQVDRDSLSSYNRLGNTVNSGDIEAQNSMTVSYIHNKLNAKRMDHDLDYSTTIDKYRNYRHGVDMLSIAINKSLTEEHFQNELENLDNLLDEIEYLQLKRHMKGKTYQQITDKEIKELQRCLDSVGYLLSSSDKHSIIRELKENGYIKDKKLRSRLIYLKRMLLLDRAPKLIEKIAQIKSRKDFNGQLTQSEKNQLRKLMQGNYIHSDYREMILNGDFDNPQLKIGMEPVRSLLRSDNAKDRYVRVQLDNRVALIEQGLVNEAFTDLEADEFAISLSAVLIRDFDEEMVEDLSLKDLSLEDLIVLYENRELVNEYLIDHSPIAKQTPEHRAHSMRMALDLLKNNEFEDEFNHGLLKRYMKSNAALLCPDDIDMMQRYQDVIVNSLASKNLINVKDIEQRNQLVSETIDNARYLIKYLERGQPDNVLKDRVESRTKIKRKGAKSKQQRNIEHLTGRDPELVHGIVKLANQQFNDKNSINSQIDKKFKKKFDKRLKNLSRQIRKKSLSKQSQMPYAPHNIAVQVPNTSHINRKTKQFADRDKYTANAQSMNKKSHDHSSQDNANKSIKSDGHSHNKTKPRRHSYNIRHFQAEKTIRQNIKSTSKANKASQIISNNH